MKRLLILAVLIGLFCLPMLSHAQDDAPISEETPPEVIQPAPDPLANAPFSEDVLRMLVSTRTDLELLANNLLDTRRPEQWNGSLDIQDPQLAILLRLDLEMLTAHLRGAGNLPAGWFGAVPSTQFAIARDIRHDLELLADATIAPNVRPPGWTGDQPIMRCDRATQGLVMLLERNTNFIVMANPANASYCQQASIEAAQFAEVNLLDLTVLQGGGGGNTGGPVNNETQNPQTNALPAANNGTFYANGTDSWAFLNRYATERVGVIPATVPFEVVARSYANFSRMTVIRGNGFEVFVDYKSTNIPEAVFNTLPNINNHPVTPACQAEWCRAVVRTSGIGGGGSSNVRGLTQVNAGTHMIIHYDGADRDGQTLVRIQLCNKPTGENDKVCQPVTRVTGPDGNRINSIGSVGGLQQFYVPYGYSPTSTQSRNYHTTELWIDSPTTRRR